MNDSNKQKPSVKKAVALQYQGYNAPKVTAKGENLKAEEILQLAKDHDVPIYEDIYLVEALAQIELGEEIPELLYLAIAEIIAFIYQLERDQSGRKKIAEDILTRRDLLNNKYSIR